VSDLQPSLDCVPSPKGFLLCRKVCGRLCRAGLPRGQEERAWD
jgi:hypothetical protein